MRTNNETSPLLLWFSSHVTHQSVLLVHPSDFHPVPPVNLYMTSSRSVVAPSHDRHDIDARLPITNSLPVTTVKRISDNYVPVLLQ